MVHLEVAIHPRIRHVDGCLPRASQLDSGKVERGDIVSIMLKSTMNASKEALAFPIGFVNASAPWASYRSVSWVDVNNWVSFFESFVFDKGLELSKSPAVEVFVLVSPMFNFVADSSQLLHYDYVAFFEAVHESLTYLVQDSVGVSPLSSAKPFQLPFGGSCAFALERRAELSKMLSPFENSFPFNFEAVRSYEKVVYANVYADGITTFRFWNSFFDCDVEKEGFISVNQDCVSRLNIFKELSLIFSYVKQWLHSLLKGSNRSINSIIAQPEKPFIQVHGKLRKLKQSISSLFVGFGNPVSGSYCKVCWKTKYLSSFFVNYVMEGYRIKYSSFKCYLRNVVASITESLNCAKQFLKVLGRRLKFADNSFRELRYRIAYMQNGYLNV